MWLYCLVTIQSMHYEEACLSSMEGFHVDISIKIKVDNAKIEKQSALDWSEMTRCQKEPKQTEKQEAWEQMAAEMCNV